VSRTRGTFSRVAGGAVAPLPEELPEDGGEAHGEDQVELSLSTEDTGADTSVPHHKVRTAVRRETHAHVLTPALNAVTSEVPNAKPLPQFSRAPGAKYVSNDSCGAENCRVIA
jgi:hypothetical protein